MRDEPPTHVPSASTTVPEHLTPPQIVAGVAVDPSIKGTRCQRDPQQPELEPRHDGCPGWWAGFNGTIGTGRVCSCFCHGDGRGWPGWVQHLGGG